MKGKKIKDLEDDFIRSFTKSNAYRKNKKLREIIVKYHKDTIKDYDIKSMIIVEDNERYWGGSWRREK